MKIEELSTLNGELVEGPLLLTPNVFRDERGWFFESWNKNKFEEAVGQHVEFSQDNHSRSIGGVLRGLHYQLMPNAQGKLVRVSSGRIYDVAVDMRAQSKTFGKWVSAELSCENFCQLWIPEGFAHGFLALSDRAEVQYKSRGFWAKSSERSICWNDPELNIQWPVDGRDLLISPKDLGAPSFASAIRVGDIY